MKIYGLNKTTLLDYPEHVAATLFTGNCNFRCPFCHNGELVVCPETQPLLPEEEVFAFLEKRKGILQGVCITGGEPTLQPDLKEVIRRIKKMGYLVKLDTNGSLPQVLENLLDEGLLDYIAMDIKSSKKGYALAAGTDIEIENIERSTECIRQSGVPYEFRTTVVKQLHSEDTFEEIGTWLVGSRAYYLQQFQDGSTVLNKNMSPCTPEEIKDFARILQKYMQNVGIRGLE